jgi:hypothetical protein
LVAISWWPNTSCAIWSRTCKLDEENSSTP